MPPAVARRLATLVAAAAARPHPQSPP